MIWEFEAAVCGEIKMEYLVTSAEMKRCDGNTIEHFGMPSMVLMERAALLSLIHI